MSRERLFVDRGRGIGKRVKDELGKKKQMASGGKSVVSEGTDVSSQPTAYSMDCMGLQSVGHSMQKKERNELISASSFCFCVKENSSFVL